MSAQGFSLREVGLAVGMTPPGVARVLKRDATPGPPVADAPKTIPTSVARAHPDCPTRDQLPPDLQVSYDAAVAEWRSGRGKTVPPDDVGAIERHLAELRATPGPVC